MWSKTFLIGTITIISPIIFAWAAFPETFDLSWNQGRGGLLFAGVFVVAELAISRMDVSRRRLAAAALIAGCAMGYVAFLEYGLRDAITGMAGPEIQLIHSWVWMWDFVVMTAYMVAVLSVCFGKRWLRLAPVGPIFLGASAVILALDAFFPYDTLGPLQYVVPYLVQANVWVITALDLGLATARDNLMYLRGDHGPMALRVYWPSAGVHSVIIYSAVASAFLLKMRIPRGRKLVYFGIGVAGTIFVNMIRIFSLSVYALKVTADPARWEEFHSVAGEMMFLPWVFIFLLLVTGIESRRLRRQEPQK